MSLNTAMMTSARVVGPAIAGLLITTVGYGWAFVADGCSYTAVILCLVLMRSGELRRVPVVERDKGQVREALRYAWGKPDLAIPLLMAAVVGTLAFNFQVVFPLVVTQTFHEGAASFTVLFSVLSLGSFLGALSAARRSDIEIGDLARASFWYGITMMAFAVVPNLAWALPIGFLVGWASVGFLTASTALVQVRSAPEMRARVLAFQAIVFIGSTPIGGPLLGAVADRFGPRSAVVVGGVACLGTAAWGWSAARRPWRPAAHTPEPDLDLPEPV